jgi:peptide deformylase
MGQSKPVGANASGDGRTMATMESGVRNRAASMTPILQEPHPALSRASYEVDPRDPETVEIAAILIGTLRTTKGCVGLTAPQLGKNVRLLCVDVKGHRLACSSSGLVILANPEILAVSGEVVMSETCASVSQLKGNIARASDIVVSGLVPGTGAQRVLRADALEARCILHAIDHLDGILFLDRALDVAKLHTCEPPP